MVNFAKKKIKLLSDRFSPFFVKRRKSPGRNLKTQLYFYGQAYSPNYSVAKAELFKNAFQTGGI